MKGFYCLLLAITCFSNIHSNEQGTKFILSSPEFADQTRIPEKCALSGKNISPELFWDSIPEGTKSFVLISRDADALPGKDVRWIVYNIPPNVNHIPSGIGRLAALPDGSFQGMNDCNHLGYDGPSSHLGCSHHYYFTLYALDEMLQLKPAISYDKLQVVMRGYIIEKTTLKGFFKYNQKIRDMAPNPFTNYCDDESFERSLNDALYFPDYYSYYRENYLLMNTNPYDSENPYLDTYSQMQTYPYIYTFPLSGPTTEQDNDPYLYYEGTPYYDPRPYFPY